MPVCTPYWPLERRHLYSVRSTYIVQGLVSSTSRQRTNMYSVYTPYFPYVFRIRTILRTQTAVWKLYVYDDYIVVAAEVPS